MNSHPELRDFLLTYAVFSDESDSAFEKTLWAMQTCIFRTPIQDLTTLKELLRTKPDALRTRLEELLVEERLVGFPLM